MFVLICKFKPRHPETEPEYRGSHKTYVTKAEADEAALIPIRRNLPFRARVVEIVNPWLGNE